MPFILQSKIVFPDFFVLKTIHCLKALRQRSFFSHNFPQGCDWKKGPHTHRESKTTFKRLFHQIFSVRMIQEA